jgi:NADPH-dependent F420 reductase
MSDKLKIAVIGGSGAEGSGLAARWALAGHAVTIGSRSADKARQAADELNRLVRENRIAGDENRAAASNSDVVVLTVPFAAQMPTVRELSDVLRGKVLVDVTAPLVPPKVSTVQLPPGGSCVVAVQKELGSDVRVVSAFQNVSAHKLKKLDQTIACDVLVCSDDKEARRTVIGLARDAGLRGIDAGPLANSVAAEAFTSLLIWINRTYKVPDAGVAITGLPDKA